ncbi:DUF998 domain-containing protein [Thermopolyspora sp. NPDC052614]|uniref:DUF998 domain-containing protein n=1 Tax=Thermopolyspora sp. NPDC052614 TaxID=3155682 RepID=UPI003444E3FA
MLPLRKAYSLIAATGLVIAMIAYAVAQIDTTAWLDRTIEASLALDSALSLEIALASAGLAGLALVAGLRAAGAPIVGWPERLMLGWAAAVSLLAALPAGAPRFVAGALSGAAFLTLAAATALLVPLLRADARWEGVARPMEWLALAQGLGLAAITYVALPGHQVMIGLVERLLLGAEVAVAGLLAVRLLQLTWAGPAARLVKRGGVTLIGRY